MWRNAPGALDGVTWMLLIAVVAGIIVGIIRFFRGDFE